MCAVLVCAAARASKVLPQIVISSMCSCLSRMMTKSGCEVVRATSRGMVASELFEALRPGRSAYILWVAPSWLWRLYQRLSRTESCLHVYLPSSSTVGQPDRMWAVVEWWSGVVYIGEKLKMLKAAIGGGSSG